MVVFFRVLHGGLPLNLAYPSCRCGDTLKVEQMCVEQRRNVYLGIVALDDSRLGLQGLDDLPDASQLFRLHLRDLVEQDDVAELYLLDDQVLDVLLADVLACQAVATRELALQAQGIDHGDDAVEARHAVLDKLSSHLRDGADGLCYGFRLTDAAGLYHDVVETLLLQYVVDLLDQVHLQRTADAAVLQGHEALVLLAHDTAFLYQVGIDVYLAYVVDDDGKLDSSLVCENTVDQRCLSAAQIACDEQDWCFFLVHDENVFLFTCLCAGWDGRHACAVSLPSSLPRRSCAAL